MIVHLFASIENQFVTTYSVYFIYDIPLQHQVVN